MIYYISLLLIDQFSFLNVFKYLTFRASGAFITSILISFFVGPKLIEYFKTKQKLGQPIRGTHPNNSGQSILEYLLEGKDTIPEDKGIFLNKTYRLNSKINNFISSNFYEERLICDDRTDKRKIKFNNKSFIKKDGIHYIEMKHKNNVQTSIEEFEVVKSLMKQLIGVEFDDNGKKRKLEQVLERLVKGFSQLV